MSEKKSRSVCIRDSNVGTAGTEWGCDIGQPIRQIFSLQVGVMFLELQV